MQRDFGVEVYRKSTGVLRRAGTVLDGCFISDYCHLARLYQRAERRGVAAELLPKVERNLARLDVATSAAQMDLAGWKLHPLKGKMKGFWSVWVSGNWRIIFRFRGADSADVDLVDYH